VTAEVITSQAHVVVVHPAVVVELGTGIIATCHNHIIATRAHFPLGIDIVCIDAHGKCIALPRTCQISLK
jgi:alpha-D-ribose 1-methylphosphonate 5-triphosphate synthase subunit PhnH